MEGHLGRGGGIRRREGGWNALSYVRNQGKVGCVWARHCLFPLQVGRAGVPVVQERAPRPREGKQCLHTPVRGRAGTPIWLVYRPDCHPAHAEGGKRHVSRRRQGQRRLEMQRQWKNRPCESLRGAGKWQAFGSCVRSLSLRAGILGGHRQALKVALKVGNLGSDYISHVMPVL